MNSSLNGLDAPCAWSTDTAFQHLQGLGLADTKRTAERRLVALGILPAELDADDLVDELGRTPTASVLHWQIDASRHARRLVMFCQLGNLPDGDSCLHANDSRGGRYWVPLGGPEASPDLVGLALKKLQLLIGKPISIFPSGALTKHLRATPEIPDVEIATLGYGPVLDIHAASGSQASRPYDPTPHLKRLEAESIHIIREAVAEAENPVMMYSVGKDSSVMLHLARKAFFPSPPPFPLLHVDTRWKFQEMYLFRDHMARESGMDLLVHVNPEAIEKNINPFDHGSALHTDITKTEGLKQALNHYKFDVVFGGARRDEEKSRAKERIFSFRTQTHRWDPKNQRPELWNLYNTRKNSGESIRVFPLSNWTELDIWQYILQENIPVVPLYFAKVRPVVVRNNLITLVDDNRLKLFPGEKILAEKVRFRTLGCYPLTGAIQSDAESLTDIILELIQARNSERQGRAIDSDASASMEKKKQEGYF